MSYSIHDLEVTTPLPAIELGPGADGIAVLVRRRGRPVWFWMEALSPGSRIEPEDLGRRIAARAANPILKEAVRDELVAGRVTAEPAPFRLTIAVCTKDRSERLARCLDSLPPGAHEILVVDNAPSDDRTRQVVAARPGVRYVREPKPGLDFARNSALAAATGDFVAFVDDDVVVDRGWLPGLVESSERERDVAANDHVRA